MAPSRRSRSNDPAPIPPREDTPEVDIPAQEHPLRFHHEDLFIQVPREDLRRLLDLVLDLNQVALRQEARLTGVEKRIPFLPSQPTPAQAAPLGTTTEPRPRWSPTRQCYTRRSPSGRGRVDQPPLRGGKLQRSRSPSRRSRTPQPGLVGYNCLGACTLKAHHPAFLTHMEDQGTEKQSLGGAQEITLENITRPAREPRPRIPGLQPSQLEETL